MNNNIANKINQLCQKIKILNNKINQLFNPAFGSVSVTASSSTTVVNNTNEWYNIAINAPLTTTTFQDFDMVPVGVGLLEELEYTGSRPISASVIISIEYSTVVGTPVNTNLRVGAALNGTSAGDQTVFLLTQSQIGRVILTPSIFFAITSSFQVDLVKGDRIKPIISNFSNTGNIIVGSVQLTTMSMN